jgi:hypothetical protein
MRVSYSLKRSDLSDELRLILSCLRLRPNEEEARQIEELSRAKIGWPDFLRWVDRHRVASLVYQNLKRYGGNGVPAAAMSALRYRFESNAHRSLANAVELMRLNQLFRKNGIAFIPLKGSVLALQVYGNLAMRYAGDIDLLIAPSQVELADHLLQTSYRPTTPAYGLSPSQGRRLLRLRHHFGYLRNQGKLRVELHWRPILNQPTHVMDLTRLHSRASTVTVAGSPLPALSLPDNLLYLCGHGGAHFWQRLFWLVDLAEIMRGNQEINWQYLTTLACEAGLMRQLTLGVILAHELLDVPLPEVIRHYALRDQMISVSARVACRHILCQQPENPPFSLRFQCHACLFRYKNSFKEKLKFLQDIFAGPYWETVSLPESLFFLYYLLRLPLWLLRRLGSNQNPGGRYKTRRKDH